eukprot:scaffold174539_cov18-Tisochrysis_lutea.AAC.1
MGMNEGDSVYEIKVPALSLMHRTQTSLHPHNCIQPQCQSDLFASMRMKYYTEVALTDKKKERHPRPGAANCCIIHGPFQCEEESAHAHAAPPPDECFFPACVKRQQPGFPTFCSRETSPTSVKQLARGITPLHAHLPVYTPVNASVGLKISKLPKRKNVWAMRVMTVAGSAMALPEGRGAKANETESKLVSRRAYNVWQRARHGAVRSPEYLCSERLWASKHDIQNVTCMQSTNSRCHQLYTQRQSCKTPSGDQASLMPDVMPAYHCTRDHG